MKDIRDQMVVMRLNLNHMAKFIFIIENEIRI
jgi:hypothetical protein